MTLWCALLTVGFALLTTVPRYTAVISINDPLMTSVRQNGHEILEEHSDNLSL